MKKPKIYIVEDDPIIAATIETALQKQGYRVIGDSENYATALHQIHKLRPDLILLDIQLEGDQDGIDLALELDKEDIPYLYLTSQTDPETITRVKKTKPLGYIVKPFTENGLRSNIELAWHNLSLTAKEYVLIKAEGYVHKIDQTTIKYLKAFDNYCYVVTTSKTLLVPHTLKHTVSKLNTSNFVKTHRSYIVNKHHIISIAQDKVILKEESIPLSTANRPVLLKLLQL
ncbi:response regulator [uncultured Dokdonia sp.]|uniref:response regulator n=1 Tax=uncultured Dokdonia sp. TaxID=575653 RepID=UPI00261DA014|nr:response regulator [uncultured Dokdonia sp.]